MNKSPHAAMSIYWKHSTAAGHTDFMLDIDANSAAARAAGKLAAGTPTFGGA